MFSDIILLFYFYNLLEHKNNTQIIFSSEDDLKFQDKLYPNFLLIDILSKLEDIKSLFSNGINLFIIAKLAKEK